MCLQDRCSIFRRANINIHCRTLGACILNDEYSQCQCCESPTTHLLLLDYILLFTVCHDPFGRVLCAEENLLPKHLTAERRRYTLQKSIYQGFLLDERHSVNVRSLLRIIIETWLLGREFKFQF